VKIREILKMFIYGYSLPWWLKTDGMRFRHLCKWGRKSIYWDDVNPKDKDV